MKLETALRGYYKSMETGLQQVRKAASCKLGMVNFERARLGHAPIGGEEYEKKAQAKAIKELIEMLNLPYKLVKIDN